MKTLIKCMMVFVLFSCASAGTYSKFKQTGTPFNFLPADREITILPEGDLSGYEEVGIVEVKNPDKEMRISEAKRLAKENGGESIMPVSRDSAGDTQRFRVLVQIKEGEELAEADNNATEQPKSVIKKEKGEIVKEKPDYSNLPVLTYRILAGEYMNLKDEKFRGSMIPIAIYDVPKELLRNTGKNKKLLELKSKKKGHKILMIIPSTKKKAFQNKINSGKELKFVYSPVTVYNTIPVVSFLDTIE